MEVLYYLWDTAHLMIAYAAMVLLKLLLQAPSCPGVSIPEAYSILKEVVEANSSAARSLSADSRGLVSSADTKPTITTVEAQARLLKAVLFRMKDIKPRSIHHNNAFNTQQDTRPPHTGVSPALNYQNDNHPPNSAQPQYSTGTSGNTVEATKTQAQWNEAQEIAEMTDEMDLSLDTSFIDEWFTQAGLLPWDEPGMFRESR
jgi:hypothetical protein